VKFTPSQTSSLTGVSPETLRYWKKHLLPIQHKRGQSPSYTRAELLSLIVVRMLVREFKMDISDLAAHSEELFRICSQVRWTPKGARLMTVEPTGRLQALESVSQLDFTSPVIVFPLNVAMSELQEKINDDDASAAQMEIALPLTSVARLGGGKQ
jgi:DNA-binding transcriptional MerR regulator